MGEGEGEEREKYIEGRRKYQNRSSYLASVAQLSYPKEDPARVKTYSYWSVYVSS